MRILLQRTLSSSVSVDGNVIGSAGKGFLLLVGVTHGDTEKDAAYLAAKCANLRIFEDENGKMNLSLLDTGGEALVVSQFTLYADCVKGRRPGFDKAAAGTEAETIYESFVRLLRENGVRHVETGKFGADMKVSLVNDGPATFLLEYPLP